MSETYRHRRSELVSTMSVLLVFKRGCGSPKKWAAVPKPMVGCLDKFVYLILRQFADQVVYMSVGFYCVCSCTAKVKAHPLNGLH